MIRPSRRRAPDPDEQIARMERVVRERVDSGRSTGIAAGMVLADGRTHCVAHGDAGQGRRIEEHSVFEIGSITKVFTATLLARDGAARRAGARPTRLETSCQPACRCRRAAGGKITLADLATQTSGLPRLPANLEPADEADPYVDYTPGGDVRRSSSSCVLTRDPARSTRTRTWARAAGARPRAARRTQLRGAGPRAHPGAAGDDEHRHHGGRARWRTASLRARRARVSRSRTGACRRWPARAACVVRRRHAGVRAARTSCGRGPRARARRPPRHRAFSIELRAAGSGCTG